MRPPGTEGAWVVEPEVCPDGRGGFHEVPGLLPSYASCRDHHRELRLSG
ncbi:hypothetical protein ACFWBB_00050 [Streptomyces sp. NPDC060000]